MKEWPIKTLGEVCEFEGGSQPPKSDFSYESKPNYIRLLQIRDYKSDDHLVYIPIEKARRFCTENDIMIGRYGPPLFQILRGLNGAYNVALMKALPDESIVTRDYMFMFLKYSKIQEYIIGLSHRAAGQTGVNKDALEKYPIAIPPVYEQQRIVSILDEAFAAIDKAKANIEKNISNAKELFQSELNAVFTQKGEGWVERRLDEICQYDKRPNKKQGLPYVGLEDIESQTGKLQSTPVVQTAQSTTFEFTNEHVLYGRLRPYLNKVLLPQFAGHCSTEIFPIKPNVALLTRGFLFHWLKHPETMKKINATWTGATLPRANMNLVLGFKLSVPSVQMQVDIVCDLDALNGNLEKLRDRYFQKLDKLEALKKSILEKAFSGELTKRVLVDEDL